MVPGGFDKTAFVVACKTFRYGVSYYNCQCFLGYSK
jgi:hypothetical protein